MSDCNIFEVFDAAESIWSEIERLVGSVPDAFAPHKIQTILKTTESNADEASGRLGYQFQAHVRVNRQQRPRQFLFAMDMWRPPVERPWTHAKTALLTFAYSPDYENGWVLKQVLSSAEGGLADDWPKSHGVAHAGGKLLEWRGATGHWHKREWLFSVPMKMLDGPDAFDRFVVRPVAALLKDDVSPAIALEGVPAIPIEI